MCNRNSEGMPEKDLLESVAVLIPAYKPTSVLNDLVASLAQRGFSAILVIDDGSGDDYHHIFDALEKSGQAEVVCHEKNRGKGCSIKTGIKHIAIEHTDRAAIVTVDADGQHRPEDIENVARALIQESESVVLGVRDFDRDVPLRSRFGNSVTRRVFRLMCNRSIRDTQTGLRGFSASLFGLLLSVRGNRYEYEMEMLLRTSKERIAVKQVSIKTVYEDKNSSSHFSPLADSIRVYSVFTPYLLLLLVAASVDLMVFALLYLAVDSIFLAMAIGRVTAVLVSLSFCNKLGHRVGSFGWRTMAIYALCSAISLFLSCVMLIGSMHFLGFSAMTLKFIVEMLFFLGNLSIQQRLLFPKNHNITCDDSDSGNRYTGRGRKEGDRP